MRFCKRCDEISFLRFCRTLAFVLLCVGAIACHKEKEVEVVETPPPPPPTTTTTSPPQSPSPRAEFIRPSAVQLPASLGTVMERFDGGKPGQPPVFIIGESHVSLPIQKTEVEVLRYLRGVYGVEVVCSEGMNGPLDLSGVGGSLTSRRSGAEAELQGRHINAVGYFALAYPDVRVVGVEDMSAYSAYNKAFDENPPSLREWLGKFSELVSQITARNQKEAVDRAAEHANGNFDHLILDLYRIYGRRSVAGRRLSDFLKSKNAAEKAARSEMEALSKPEHPLFQARDEGLAAGTVDAMNNSQAVALVVGVMHLPGITAKLKAREVPYLAFSVKGVEKEVNRPRRSRDLKSMREERLDEEIYNQWRKNTPTPSEGWLTKDSTKNNPEQQLIRSTLQRTVGVLGGLANADLMLRRGSDKSEVMAALAKANLSQALEITEVYLLPGIPDGFGIEFRSGERKGYAYFSSKELRLPAKGRIDEGEIGGRHFALYEGGGGKKPPLPPGPPPPGPGDFERRFFDANRKQNETQPGAVTVGFFVRKGFLVRYVGDRYQLLGVSLAQIAPAIKAYRDSKSGPDRLLAAQQIAAALLVGIDDDLLPGKTALFQHMEKDFLGDLSLARIAAEAREPRTERLAQMKEIYTVPWEGGKADLTALSKPVSPVATANTVFWLTDDLKASPVYSATVTALQKSGVRLNESLHEGDTLILVGTRATNWRVSLQGGRTVSSSMASLHSVIREPGGIVTFNAKLPLELEAKAPLLRQEELTGDQALAEAKELAERIREGNGKETLDHVLRSEAGKERSEARDHLAGKVNFEKLAPAMKSALAIDAKATMRRE